MNKKNLETIGLGGLHEFAANAVYPRKPRRLSKKKAYETLSVDSQLHEFAAEAISPPKNRTLANDAKRRPATQRKKTRGTRGR